jgi:hypothetical protein
MPGYRYKIASVFGNKTDSVLENLTGSDWVLASGSKGIIGGGTYLEVAGLGSNDPGFGVLLAGLAVGTDGKAHRTHY